MADIGNNPRFHPVGLQIAQHHPVVVTINKASLREALKDGLDEQPIKHAPMQFTAKYLNADVEIVIANSTSKNSDWWVFFREEHREQAMLFKMSYG